MFLTERAAQGPPAHAGVWVMFRLVDAAQLAGRAAALGLRWGVF
jgi:hypothetical protein